MNIQGFDFTNGFRCSDAQKFENIFNLSINIFELNFYQDKNNWKHDLVSLISIIEINKNDSNSVID